MFRIRSLGAALALCAIAAGVNAQAVWDGVVQVPGMAAPMPGEFLICPPGTHLNPADRVCLEGRLLPTPKGLPQTMTLQQVLDQNFTAPAGMVAQAVGPMLSFDRTGVDAAHFGIAYRLIKR